MNFLRQDFYHGAKNTSSRHFSPSFFFKAQNVCFKKTSCYERSHNIIFASISRIKVSQDLTAGVIKMIDCIAPPFFLIDTEKKGKNPCPYFNWRARELTSGKIASYSSRLTSQELAVHDLCIEILFSKTTYPIGPSLIQPYLLQALALPILRRHE